MKWLALIVGMLLCSVALAEEPIRKFVPVGMFSPTSIEDEIIGKKTKVPGFKNDWEFSRQGNETTEIVAIKGFATFPGAILIVVEVKAHLC
jgi:hypothetical protein